MTARERMEKSGSMAAGDEIKQRAEHLDEDLAIMDRHAADLAGMEDEEQASMRRWDREHKDAHLHSVPRHLKHVR